MHVEQARQGAQESGLARAVGAEQRDDRAGRHGETDAAQHEHHIVVHDLEIANLKQAGLLGGDPPMRERVAFTKRSIKGCDQIGTLFWF
ncbi:hypothetical protein GCM10010412_054150 [Nonomuraea recticatena]|uniref:Uncharacterized protein n=1 Tax=Nonomuraea recticatena TaxID=46178 RepID=A0ABN3SC61_9ACTN